MNTNCPRCGRAINTAGLCGTFDCPGNGVVWTMPDLSPVKLMTAPAINSIAAHVHNMNTRWWRDPATGYLIERNVGEMLMLVTSELAEALEGHRKGLMDDKLPHRRMFEVELADALIRLLDIAGGLGLDLGGAMVEKLAYNATRQDHTDAARLSPGGKKY
jgi:hypothetical protein